ncbi:MAG: TonB-dependent receptor plug domain-containing protein, partial [Bacteroidia bacterium]
MRNKLSCIASIISRNFIFFIFLLFYVNTNAQITGKLSDSKNNIPYCNVLLLKSTDSLLITGATTDSVGLFQLEIKDTGSFYIQVDYFGYKRWKSNTITIPNKKYSLNLGTIMLEQDARSLKQIEVVAEKPFMEHKIDRTIYNIQNSIMGGGYNGLEVLKKLPGVTVNNNDEISVRGKSGVLLTIDGKTSYMSAADAANYLKSLDASQIEKIEVITNPSAKFDASGNAVINIVLVKDKNLGLNAQLYTGYSQGFYNSASVGGNANYRTKKFNFFANFNSYRFNSYNISDQKNIFSTNGLPSATFVDHIRQGINNK